MMKKKKVKPMKKPPLGVIPRHLWDEERLEALNDAIYRYNSAGMVPHIEWLQERDELERRYGLNQKQTIIGFQFDAEGSISVPIKSHPLFEEDER